MVQKVVQIIDLVSDLSLFKTYHGGITELFTTDHGEDKLFVIDSGMRGRATYGILSDEGWIVFTRPYANQDVVYPSVYGILIEKMDISEMANAITHGISIPQLNEICGEIRL